MRATGRKARWTRAAAALLGAAAALALAGARAEPAACLAFEPAPVAVQGTLRLQVFAGPPHYRSIESGDQAEAIWMLQPDAPLCVAARDGEIGSITLQDVRSVQVVPRTPLSMSLNGRAARLQGTLSRPHDGHAHALVLLRTTHAEAAAAP